MVFVAPAVDRSTDVASPDSGCLFFAPPLRLDSTSAGTAATDEQRARRVARELLDLGGLTRWPSGWQAMRHVSKRVDRARLLFAAADAAERGRAAAASADALAGFEAEWTWMARSGDARAVLSARARALGAAKPDEVARRVGAAIEAELLPLARVRWLLLASPDDKSRLARHRAALASWRLPDKPSALLATAFGWHVLALVRDGEEPDRGTDANMVQLVRSRGVYDADVSWILAAYARAQLQLLGKRLEAQESAGWFERRLTALEAVERSGGTTLSIFEAMSYYAFACGARKTANNSSFGDGMVELAKAIVYNPINADARNHYRSSCDVPSALQAQVNELLKANRPVNPAAGALIKLFDDGVARGQAFFASEKAKGISTRLQAAARHALVWRLGLRFDADSRERTDALFALIDQFGAYAAQMQTALPAEVYAPQLRAMAIERRADLETLPWDRITPVLERGVMPNADVFALLLPEPDPPDLSAIVAAVRDADVPLRAPPKQQSGDWMGVWLFSRQDLWHKAALAAGILLLMYAGAARSVQFLGNALTNGKYNRVVTALRLHDDSAAVDAAFKFLDHRADVREDPRVQQVAEWLDDATVRRLVTLAGAKRADDARELLTRYEQRRAADSVIATSGQ